MPNQMFIWFYSAQQSTVDWLLVDSNRTMVQSGSQQELNELPPLKSKEEVIAIIPSHDVLLTTAKLPKTNYNKLIQAIPYALEEQLIDEVEDLHFAIGEWQNEQRLPIAAISEQRLQQWLQKLADANLHPAWLIPAVFALPPTDKDHWTIAVFPDQVLFRTGLQSGCSSDSSNWLFMLQLLLQEAKNDMPARITLLNYTKAPLKQPTLSVTFEINDSPTTLLEQIAQNWPQNRPINLLQGIYKSKQKNKLKSHWRPAILLASIWLAVVIFGNAGEYFYLRYQNYHLQQQIVAAFHQTFPAMQNVVDPREAIERELNRLNATASGSTFLKLFAKTGAILKDQRNITINQLSFSDSKLNLKLTADNFATLAQFVHALQQKNLTVKQNNVTSQGKQVSAEVVIQ